MSREPRAGVQVNLISPVVADPLSLVSLTRYWRPVSAVKVTREAFSVPHSSLHAIDGLAAAAHKSGLQAFISKTSMPESVWVNPQVDTSAGPPQFAVQRKKNSRFGYHVGAQGKAIVPGIAGANAKSNAFRTSGPLALAGTSHELAGI